MKWSKREDSLVHKSVHHLWVHNILVIIDETKNSSTLIAITVINDKTTPPSSEYQTSIAHLNI